MDAHPSPVTTVCSRPLAPDDSGNDVGHALFLMLADGEGHRLEDLAREVAATPGQVVRDIGALAACGMAIETAGDTVRAAPYVVLDATEIERRLHAATRPPDAPAWQASVAFATDSTNADLLAEVRGDARFAGRRLRTTEIQHRGRGRLGRGWISAPGASLTASFALRIARPLAQLDGVALACGLAVHDVLAARCTAIRLKWPNDILLDGRKLAGILVEAHPLRGGTALVIGVGINIAATAAEGRRGAGLPVARLQADGSAPIDRNALAAGLALALEAQMTIFEATGFPAFADRWNAADAFRDLPVTLSSIREPDLAGIARGIDERGALLLDVDGTRRRIIVGDVSLRLASQPVP